MEHSLIIIGGGGHTGVLVGMLKREGRAVKGIVTRDPALLDTDIHGVPVIGLEDDAALDITQVQLVNGVGNRASKKGSGLGPRAELFQRYKAQGFTFASVVSQQAIIQPDVLLGSGVQVMPGAVIQPGAMIGENAIINTRASIDHDVVIHPHAHIGPGAVLCGEVVVGERTHIGAGAILIQGVKIGHDVVIAAGVTVTQDVPDEAVVLASTR